MSSVTVKIPTPLRPITSGQSEVKVEGATVGEILRTLDSQFKGFGERVLEDGKNVKRFINIFVNERDLLLKWRSHPSCSRRGTPSPDDLR